jgi:glutaryl-CoA dehydrogenase
MAFRGVDYLLIDSQLSHQELLVRQTARRFVDERVLPLLRDCFRDARFPSELIPEIGELGFLGANLHGYGCAGMSNVEYGLVMQEVERADEGIRGFLVEKGTPGFTTSDIHGKWSMRASVTSSLSFADCRVPGDAMLPGARGLKGPLGCLSQARYGIGWGVLGAAMDCYETARSYTILRKQFDDKPIASHQLVQAKLAGMITEITKAQLLALHCGRLKDTGKLEPAHISMLTRNNVAIALDCARTSRDLLGANGITDEYPIMRHLCNLETVKTYEGTDHVHALVIGERVTGIAAYK